MNAAALDARIVAAVQDGLPLTPAPYAVLAERAGVDESVFRARLAALLENGAIKRFGIVVHHRALGFRANAMVVWDVPDDRVRAVGETLAAQDCVTLCYRRPRRPPRWPYNLFCMIHGRDRDRVREQVRSLAALDVLQGVAHDVLFSTRRFKQRGARYVFDERAEAPEERQ